VGALALRGLHTHFPAPLVNPIQSAVERAASRSPSALSILYDTDKGPTQHLYTPRYREFFGQLRSQPLTLLESGISRGGVAAAVATLSAQGEDRRN
jgi:hypothetical protein